MAMRGSLWLLVTSACWMGASEPAAPRPNANNAAGEITCEQYWAHVDEVFGTPDEVSASLPVTREHCVEFERFTDEQRRCFLGATTPDTLVLCAIPDPQQRAEALKLQPTIKRAWPGTATAEAVRDTTKGCASLGIDPRQHWRTNAGIFVAFLLRDSAALRDPKEVIATLAPSTWTCIATEPAGMCEELQLRCRPNAPP